MFGRIPDVMNVNAKVDVDVVEKRAPTDESVRLLMEMQRKAEENRLSAILTQSTDMQVLVELHEEFLTMGLRAVAAAKLNGRVIRSATLIRREEAIDITVKRIAEDLGKAIAEAFIEQVFRQSSDLQFVLANNGRRR